MRSTAQRNVLVCSLLAVLLSGACAPTAHRVTVASGHTKLEITALTFFGVDVVREEQLRDVVRTKPARWWPWAKPRYFDAHTFAADLQRIMAFYKAHGYPDARITSHAVDIDHEELDVRVTIVIDEGEHVRAPEVAWRPDVPA